MSIIVTQSLSWETASNAFLPLHVQNTRLCEYAAAPCESVRSRSLQFNSAGSGSSDFAELI